ncbi:MAG TPA: glycosyltransferase family 4 protein [Terriglobales bacterium]|nr:glycosyltransferase family 4 protein [Terriglobales bacterium]
MKIALIAPPFIAVPPAEYGGTELFIAQLAEGLQKAGAEVVVYANGESRVGVEVRSMYEHSQWPIKMQEEAWLKDLSHESWAVRDAIRECDVIHLHSPAALAFTSFIRQPAILTLHGPHEKRLSEFYRHYPDVYYVCISNAQCRPESLPRKRTIHHGIDLSQYHLVENKQQYLSFIGRIAPMKGTHIAIDVARRTGIPLRIAGEVQPMYREYFEQKIKPHIDGELVQYVGRADLQLKNELLGNSMAMLFPIQWNEPFGLVMVEAMACGTPVLAMPGGSVPEVIQNEVSGYICRTVRQMVKRVGELHFEPKAVRRYVEDNFSLDRMVRNYLTLYEEALKEEQERRVA